MLPPNFHRISGLFIVALATCLLVMEPAVAQRPDFGGDRRGGDPGGGRGGQRGRGGGPPGGFDPTPILQRMDRNGNGRLDPDEIDGRAKFMIERFAPGVDTSRSISLDDMRKKIQEARENRDGGNPSNRGGDRRRGEPETIEIEPLVPGFGEEIVLEPVPGFGGSGEFFAVSIIAADEVEADRTVGRYDRNKNGKLDREEVRQGRWSDDPTVYDQNGDGALTKRELSVRYAKRRLAKESERENDRRGRDRRDEDRERRERDQDREKDKQDERKSYRFLTAHERLPKGIPDWFRQKDIDLDGQIGMNEYAGQWNDETVAAFTAIDLDGDGVLSPAEALQRGAEASSSSNAKSGEVQGGKENDTQEIPEKYLTYAQSYVKKYDENGDAVLSQKEVAAMRRPPQNADLNGDGQITAEEFARSIMR